VIAFVLVAAVMIAIALACVLVPLLRGGKPAGVALDTSKSCATNSPSSTQTSPPARCRASATTKRGESSISAC
jgi:hypothetical protein